MYIGTPNPIQIQLLTDKTVVPSYKLVPVPGGAIKLDIQWDGSLAWAEWRVQGSDVPLRGCYCNDPMAKVVICDLGKFVMVTDP
jgi:hypothetical protein